MAVSTQILRTYRHPRAVIRGLFAASETDDRPEARGFIYLLLGCLIMFLGRLPGMLAAEMTAPDAPPTEALVSITFFLMLTVWPLFFILLAGIVHVVARAVGGQGTFLRSRLSIAWTVLAVSPLSLLRGMVESVTGSGPQLLFIDGLIALAFCMIWAISLTEAERPAAA